jgi:hypothetical protein
MKSSHHSVKAVWVSCFVLSILSSRTKPNFVPLLKGNLSQIPGDAQEILRLNNAVHTQSGKGKQRLAGEEDAPSRSIGRVGMFSQHGIFAQVWANFAN